MMALWWFNAYMLIFGAYFWPRTIFFTQFKIQIPPPLSRRTPLSAIPPFWLKVRKSPISLTAHLGILDPPFWLKGWDQKVNKRKQYYQVEILLPKRSMKFWILCLTCNYYLFIHVKLLWHLEVHSPFAFLQPHIFVLHNPKQLHLSFDTWCGQLFQTKNNPPEFISC